MNEKQWFAGLLAVTAAVGAGVWWFLLRDPTPEPAPAPVAEVAPALAPAPSAPAAPEYPVPATEPDETAAPVPASLAESDAPFLDQLVRLLGAPGVEAVLVNEQLIRRIVVAVDNLPRERVGLRDWPVKRTAGSLAVQADYGAYVLQRENGARYNLAVTLVKAVDADALVKLYFRYYPLFNSAYRELGYPQAHFNDRLVQVIDHLLAAPTPAEPVLLVQPKVMYQFSDPALEALSFGQKLMIRIGSENRAVVTAKLREIRARVVAGVPPA